MNRFFEIKKSGLTKADFLDADSDIDLSNLDEDFCIHSVATLENAKSGDLSFFTITLVSGNKYKHSLENTQASYCLLKKQYTDVNKNVKPIVSSEPYITFMRLCDKIFVPKLLKNDGKISKTAQISDKSSIGEGVVIGDNVVIEEFVKIADGVEIGEGSVVKSGAKIGYNCVIGKNCVVNENATIQFAEIGDFCRIQANATIGQDGFGFTFDRRTGKNEKINHFGFVKIGNAVEVGANSCIDRGVFDATIIEDDVKLDNLVQIAHNVKIGEGTMMAGQTGIAGSAVVGKHCMLGGKCGMAGHITLGDQCIMYGATNISKGFPKHSKIIGTPGELYHIWIKNYSFIQYFLKKQRRKVKVNSNYEGVFGYLRNLFGVK